MIKNYLQIFISLFILFLFAAGLLAESRYAAEEEFFAMQEQVVVSASKHEQKISEAPAAISVITANDIKNYGYKTIGEALNQIPGLYMSTDRSNEYGIVRGIHLSDDNNKRILVLLNGHTLNNAMTMEASLGSELGVPMESIERIEVMRGAGSVMYGSNAFFGVVNIILKNNSNKENLDDKVLDLTAGSHKLYENSIMVNKSINKNQKLFIATFLRDNDGAPVSLENNYSWWAPSYPWFPTPEQNFVSKDIEVARADFDRVSSVIGSYKIGNFEIFGKHTLSKEGMPLADWQQVFTSPQKSEEEEINFIEISYSDMINKNFNYTFKVFTNDYEYRNDIRYVWDQDDDASNGGEPEWYYDIMKSNWSGSELKFDNTFCDGKINSISGIEFITRNNKARSSWMNLDYDTCPNFWPANAGWFDKKINSFAVYDEITYNYSEKIKNVFGLRYDKLTDFDGEFSPRIAVLYNQGTGKNYKFILAKAFRAQGFKEYDYDDNDLYPNPDIEPEIVYSADLIGSRVFKNLTLNVDLFYNKIDDLTFRNTKYSLEDAGFRDQNQNPFKTKSYGIESGITGKFQKINYFLNLMLTSNNINGSWNLTDVEGNVSAVNVDRKLFNTSEFSMAGGINFDYQKYKIGITANYLSSRDIREPLDIDTNAVKTVTGIEEIYPTKVKSSVLVNLNINSPELWNCVYFNLYVKDIFDSKREEPARSTANINMIKTEGRNFIGKIVYKF